jgi:hypothetical protein
MALKNVTNAQILDALRLIGYGDDILGGADITGAQNSTFRSRIVGLGIHDADFDQAKNIARQVGDEKFNAGGNQVSEIIAALQRRGVGDDIIRQIVATAIQSPLNQQQPGTGAQISQGQPGAQTFDVDSRYAPQSTAIGGGPGAPVKVNVNAFLDAASRLNSGATESVRKLMTSTPNVSTPPPPSAQPATAPAPTPPGGGVTMGTTRSRATPGVAAPTAPSTTGGQAGGGAGAATTGGPNNQPPPPATWNDDQIKTFIKQNFGANAYFVDIPEVWDALKNVVKSGKGINGLEPALETTQFWKQNTAAARNWYVRERSDPAQTAADIAQQTQAITNTAQQAGITLDPVRAQQMAQSYLRYGWTQTDLQRAIGAEWHYDPSTKNQAAAVTKMKTDAQNWLVPLSNDAIQTWGQGLISGTVTQDQYTQYLRDNAKSLMPQLSTLIDQHAGDPKFSVSTFADPYKQHAANLLGLQPDQIDLNDSKWRKALDTVDPKTGERRIMSLGEWESTIKTDPTYGYDKTANGINDGLQLAGALKTSMGF